MQEAMAVPNIDKQQWRQICGQIDVNNIWQHLEYLSSLEKVSGSQGAAKAVRYIQNEVEA
jgi:hypothetical protein